LTSNFPAVRNGTVTKESIPVQRGKNLGKWATAKPGANEARAAQAFADDGYDVMYLNRADDLGISGKKRPDLQIDGIGRVGVWIPPNPNVNATKTS